MKKRKVLRCYYLTVLISIMQFCFALQTGLAQSKTITVPPALKTNPDNRDINKISKWDDPWINAHLKIDRIVPVETTDDCLIDYFRRIILYNDKLIILTQRAAIFVVNAYTGKLETSIIRIGQGPGESIKILDIIYTTSLTIHGKLLAKTVW